MNFFNNPPAAKKSQTGGSAVIDVASTQATVDTEWTKNNLSWAESISNLEGGNTAAEEEDIIFDSNDIPKVKDLIQANSERTIASMFTSTQQDIPMAALVKALDAYPSGEYIETQRQILDQNISKLQKAKVVLSAVTTIAQGVNPDAVKAYTSTEAALNESIISREKFEAELRVMSQGVKQLIANAQTTPENAKIAQGIVELYGFLEVN